jgi:hypothetical protein
VVTLEGRKISNTVFKEGWSLLRGDKLVIVFKEGWSLLRGDKLVIQSLKRGGHS